MVDERVFLSFIWPLVLNESRVKRLIRVHFSVLCVCATVANRFVCVCGGSFSSANGKKLQFH